MKIQLSSIDLSNPQWALAIAVLLVAASIFLLAFVTAFSITGLIGQLRRTVQALGAATEARRRDRTLEAVRRYETDPQLREAIRTTYERTNQGTDYSLLGESDRFNIITILNYFDGIACGIEQGLLVESLVKDYLQFVLDKNVCALLRGQSGPTWDAAQPLVDPDNFSVLLQLHDRWREKSQRSLYEMLR